ncbi:MAG: GH3 auxin-responsive promoter family protein [Muribaculaceae bacterium]|nr:GH3 auxin-responsive promoter family protein [Muribaculaceae bacterium]
MDFTPIARYIFASRAKRTENWRGNVEELQRKQLKWLINHAADTEIGRKYGFKDILNSHDPVASYHHEVPTVAYDDIRPYAMRMVEGESDVLWPGQCKRFAQSSGTSGGKSKFVPITNDCLRRNHYPGTSDVVAHYLKMNPQSRIFSGKSLILGGSFANELDLKDNVKVGDLSATLIDRMPKLADMVRVPEKRIALMEDWSEKLPALAGAASKSNITNISGVPSWFLTVIKEVCRIKGVDKVSEVWPNLEVFFHGGIDFRPYRKEYEALTERRKMHFMETYNASEGFFAFQNDFSDPSMLLILDGSVYYEFEPLGGGDPVPAWGTKAGKTYELLISSSNGLWRYHLGDTVTVTATDPVKIRIAGRTRSFINAFGEEVMEDNANRAIEAACEATGAGIANYTAGPYYAHNNRRGHHQWLIEWNEMPDSMERFRDVLDKTLQEVNSDYQAKRAHTIFLDPPEIITARQGLFDDWLANAGNHKLGGQRKVPRLNNNRNLLDELLAINA